MMIDAILRPVEGNTESINSLAASLTSGAAKLSSINAVLVNIKAGASWDSPAGEVFEQRVRESPPLLDALVHRYAGAAAALRVFATEHGKAQDVAQQAIASNRLERAAYATLDVQMTARMDAGQTWDDLLSEQNKVLERMGTAQRQHAHAWERFERADRLLARQLRALADDILDDSWHYTALTEVQGFSQGLSSLPAPVKKMPVLGQVLLVSDAVNTLSQVAIRVFYDEGSWKDIGINTAANVTVLGAASLKSGALAASRPLSGLADGKRAYLGESLATKDRFLIGTRAELHKKYTKLGQLIDPKAPLSRMVVPVDKVPRMAPTDGLKLKEKVQVWRAHGTAVARRQADKSFFDDWRAVSAGGANAKKMFVAGSTLEKAVPKVKDAANNQVAGKPEEKVSAPTYP
ncbi:hypothetical protein V6K52_12320 [Knoellia sp. S7-12]|uniref:hypothetical protein n=1 Tax=Knoellia sp. S7-12 TaxID=3126698 RepID=UPI003367B404